MISNVVERGVDHDRQQERSHKDYQRDQLICRVSRVWQFAKCLRRQSHGFATVCTIGLAMDGSLRVLMKNASKD
ncbi:hypothetical protein ACQR16_20380 [Bradyrhizobium oligotrophicum]